MRKKIITQAFFDIGGSKTDFRLVEIEVRGSQISPSVTFKETVKTPSEEHYLINLLKDLLRPFKINRVIMGVPGAVPQLITENSCIYLPPLGYSLSVGKLQADFGDLVLINDMQVLGGLTRITHSDNIVELIDLRLSHKIVPIERKALLAFGTSVGFMLSIYHELCDEYIDIPLEIAHRKQPSRYENNVSETLMEIFDGRDKLPDIDSEREWTRYAAFFIENIIKEYKIDTLYIAGGRRMVLLRHFEELRISIKKHMEDRGRLAHEATICIFKDKVDLFSHSATSLSSKYL